MSTPTDEPVPVSIRRPRGALGRDLLRWFLLGSIVLHASSVLPWARVIGWVNRVLHRTSDVWNETKDDHPTVIPIDLDQLDEPEITATNNGQGDDGYGGHASNALDGGTADAPSEAGDAAAMLADAARDGALDDAASDAETGADAGPGRVPDPTKAAGGVLALKPVKGEVNVSILIRTDHMRAHPLGAVVGSRIALIHQWKAFLEGTAIDPVADVDAIFADGPRFYETSRVTTIIVHSKPDQLITDALNSIAKAHPDAKWVGGDQVEALKVKIDDAVRVLVEIPGGLIITPEDGQKQAIDIAIAMQKKKSKGADLLPKGNEDLIFSAYLRTPSHVMKGVPEDLTDTHVTIRTLPDQGVAFDLDATAKSATAAIEDADVLKKLIASQLTGIKGAILKGWVEGYTLEETGNVVHFHHELTGDSVRDIWNVVQTFGL